MSNAWDRLPEETELAYRGFTIYLSLKPPRTVNRTVEAGGGAFSTHSATIWSWKHNWVARAANYDSIMADKEFTTKLNNVSDFQDKVMSDELEDYEKLRDVWNKLFAEMMGDEYEIGDRLNNIQKLVRTRQAIDSMGRKLAQMPNNYTGKQSEKQQEAPEQIVITKEGIKVANSG